MNQADGVGGAIDGGEDGAVLFGLISVAHVLEDRLEEALFPHGLSLAKLNVLSRLAEAGGPLSLGEIATRLQCVRSNVTQLVDRLEADGLVVREPDPVDRRSVRAVLTEHGRARQRDGALAVADIQAAVASALRGHDRPALERALAALG